MFTLTRTMYSYPLFWLAGLYPAWGGLALINIIKPQKTPSILLPFIIFFAMQLCSILNSFYGEWYQSDRLVPITHNLFVYLVFISGIAAALNLNFKDHNEVYLVTRNLIILFSAFSIAIFMLQLSQTNPISIKTPFLTTGYSRIGFIFGYKVPRVSVFSPYPNASAILMLTLFFLNQVSRGVYFSLPKLNATLYLLTLISIIMTGSRLVTILALAYPLFYYTQKLPIRVLLNLAIIPFIIIFFSVGGLNSLDSTRENSSKTRYKIYNDSVEIAMSNSPMLGLGIKPKKTDLSHFPIGSHSSFLGYITKNGFIGFLFVCAFVFWVLFKYLQACLGTCNRGYLAWLMVCISTMAFFFEDLDAFEFNAFIYGLIFGFAVKTPPLQTIDKS